MDENLPVALQAALCIWAVLGPVLMGLWIGNQPDVRRRRRVERVRSQPPIWEVAVTPTGFDQRMRVVTRRAKRLNGEIEVVGDPIVIATIDPNSADYDPDQISDAIARGQALITTMQLAGAA